ncbi:hypothetical protein [Flagellimonas nanhaiensis]|uniref:Uncharacterized protein n=1 Tax=Flagellimonas nanhaiensis TaxID=2292706 RepID=A0A371JUN8_9FLAO|nr:hypothetical protein [Allomuricauda nanhaiensis]RDY61510.1 hypothetical protein DX873_04960 [Allomuricauda nanhaiensis]
MDNFKTKQNLVLCGNHEYIVKVDQLYNKKIRYLCWKRPKTFLNAPDLILLNGEIKNPRKKGSLEIVFSCGTWIYTIEKIQTKFTVHIFFETKRNDGLCRTWKMSDLGSSNSLQSRLWLNS